MAFFTSLRTMERKKLYLWGSIGTVTLVVVIVIIVVSTSGSTYVPKGSDALSNAPLVDGHNDLPNNLREKTKNKIIDFKFNQNLKNDSIWGTENCKYCYTDLPRLREGKVGSVFWVAYVYASTQYKDAVAQTLEQIDVIRRLVRKYPSDMQFVTTADGIMDAFNNKKIGSLIGVEGGHSIDSRVGVLRTFYDLGVRYMTLTHSDNVPWADASPVDAPDKAPVSNLTTFGVEIVKEMNRLGMMVDLSHVSAEVMRLAINASRAPVIFSHSNARSIYNHHRNVPDDVLDLVKNNGGIVMINFYAGFLKDPNEKNATLFDVIEHINYIANRTGPDHIGIGADYDGIEKAAIGLEDVSKYPVLFDTLYQNDSSLWTIENLEKLAGRNLIRVFKKVEEVRDELKSENSFEEWISAEDLYSPQHLPEKQRVCRTERDVADEDPAPTEENNTTVISNEETTASTLG